MKGYTSLVAFNMISEK